MTTQDHWQNVYVTKDSTQVSWFQAEATQSLAALRKLNLNKDTAVIDIGGGASYFVDNLIADGWSDISVLDIAESALAKSKLRLGADAKRIEWIVNDITKWQPHHVYGVWHDRAVFHFLTEEKQRDAYRQALLSGLALGGHVVLATFALDGPEKCSGLPVQRYDAAGLQKELGPSFTLLENWSQTHITPSGGSQKFNWCLFKRV